MIIKMRFPVMLLLLFELFGPAIGNEVIGCGGFIKSNTEINYKIIKVKLLTKERAVKYTTESSPINGYYMIPIYTKGEYILQVNPPPGWSFEPTEINVNVDGQNDACSKNEDMNFFFKGFGLSGKVVTLGDLKNNGPSGIKLNLIANEKVIDSTVSASDGSYYFSNVMPGAYQVEAQHPSIQFLTNKVNVELSKENWSAKDNIVVSGYKIEGQVVTSNKSPIKDAIVQLYFSDNTFVNIDTSNFGCDLSSKSDLKICHLKTDSNGKFSFLNVAFGKYRLEASLQKENLKFSMQPGSIMIDLTKHQDLLLAEAFKLNKVSIASQALLGVDAKLIENGQVYINDQKTGIQIDINGNFILADLTSGSYKIKIKSEHVFFEEKLINLDLSSLACVQAESSQYQRLLSLTKFVAVAFDVCGEVKVIKEQNINNLFKAIEIKVYEEKKFIKSAKLDANFKYCLSLDAGHSYVLKAELVDLNMAKKLKLIPVEQQLQVTNSPVMNVNFEQLEAKLNGQIMLLPNQDMPASLIVTIKSEDSKQTKDITAACDQNICHFSLTNLLFGNYYLTTNYDDLFCWKTNKPAVLISINSENQNVLLEQSGFLLNYQFSHPNTLLKIRENTEVLIEKSLKTNSDLTGFVCLPQATNYELLIESCHKYSTSATDFDLFPLSSSLFQKGLNKINLKADKTQVVFDVSFKFDESSQKQADDVTDNDLSIEVHDGKQLVELVKLKLKSKSKNELVFSGKSWFVPHQQIRVVAKSNKVLFETNTKEIKVSDQLCQTNRVAFEAKLGIFISGVVTPSSLTDIELTLTSTLDRAVITRTIVNAAEGFKLGPLKAPHTLYNVELVKAGFLFAKQLGESNSLDTVQFVFTAEKLGQLKVSVIERKSSRATLDNVLLSLTSENRLFRQTSRTDEHGKASFVSLKPGLYYLIVMMQEYEFHPNSHPIQITDGFEMDLEIEAERIAYSCLGRVSSINGQAEANIQVDAVGVSSVEQSEASNELCLSSQESAVVENGFYHIFNLKPACEYKLTLKNLNKRSEKLRIVPDEYRFVVGDADVLKKDFILLEQIDKVDLTVGVSFKLDGPLANNYVKVKLFKMNQPDSVVQTQFAVANSIIYFNSIPRDSNQQYSVQISLLASSSVSLFGTISQQQQLQLQQQPVIDSVELGFYANSAHKHLAVSFDKKNQENSFFDGYKKEQYQNFYMTLPLFILIVGVLLNSKKVQQQLYWLKNFIQQKGGVVKALQSIMKPQAAAPVSTVTNPHSTKSNRSNYLHQKNRDSSANNSDLERSPKYSPRQPSNTSVFNEEQVLYKAEIENYEIINSDDLADMQISNRKQRVKKTD